MARQLILKYPFTKDDLGCGYVSSLFASAVCGSFDPCVCLCVCMCICVCVCVYLHVCVCAYMCVGGVHYCEYVSYSYFQQSWSDKMIERVKNIIKTDNRKARQAGDYRSASLPVKRQKKVHETELTRRYPVIATNMDIEVECVI